MFAIIVDSVPKIFSTKFQPKLNNAQLIAPTAAIAHSTEFIGG